MCNIQVQLRFTRAHTCQGIGQNYTLKLPYSQHRNNFMPYKRVTFVGRCALARFYSTSKLIISATFHTSFLIRLSELNLIRLKGLPNLKEINVKENPIRPAVREAVHYGKKSDILQLPFWAAAPKGRCPVGHRGEFPDVRTSVRPSVRTSPCSNGITLKIDKKMKFPLNNIEN